MIARRAGFSLIEILLAVALLALGVTIASAALRGAVASVQRAEGVADQVDQVRSVQRFIRRHLTAAQPLDWSPDGQSDDLAERERVVVQGEADSLRFVSAMPGYLSQGGPYLHSLRLVSGRSDLRLEFDHQLVIGGQLIPEANREPVLLLDGIAAARFEYFGLDDDGEVTGWQSPWPYPSRMPQLIRLDLRFTEDNRRWPPLSVALTLSQSATPMVVGPGGRPPLPPVPGSSRRPGPTQQQ